MSEDKMTATTDNAKPRRRSIRTSKNEHIDGSWSYAVGLSSLLAQIMLGGYAYTGGIYYTVFVKEFEEIGPVAVSWMCNLPLTLWFFGSPIGSLLTTKFGPRTCSYIGGCLASTGILMGSLTNNFYVLFLGYGVIAGFGHGIMYIGFITSVTRYFQKYRAMVTVLASLGPMIGMAVYSFLIPYLIDRLHWRGSLMIMGGIAFNICVCASLLYPLETIVSTRNISVVSVLRIKSFSLFACNSVFFSLAQSLMFLHLPSLIMSYNIGSNMPSVALTVFAISNSGAKIICSLVGHFIPAEPVNVYNGFLMVYSICIMLFPVMGSEVWVLMVVTVMSFCFNVSGGHTMEVVLNLTGADKFTSGLGVTQFCKAIGILLGGPVAGFLYEMSGNYKTTFYVSGFMGLISCVILMPVTVQKCRGVASGAEFTNSELTVQETKVDETTNWLNKIEENN